MLPYLTKQLLLYSLSPSLSFCVCHFLCFWLSLGPLSSFLPISLTPSFSSLSGCYSNVHCVSASHGSRSWCLKVSIRANNLERRFQFANFFSNIKKMIIMVCIKFLQFQISWPLNSTKINNWEYLKYDRLIHEEWIGDL